jgi:hypothetical protein
LFERQPGLTPTILYYFGFIVIAVFGVLMIWDLFLVIRGENLVYILDPQTVIVRLLSAPFAVVFGIVFMNLFPELQVDEEAISVRYFPAFTIRIPWADVDDFLGPLDSMVFQDTFVLILNQEALKKNSWVRYFPKSHGSILQQPGPSILVSGEMESILQVIERRV